MNETRVSLLPKGSTRLRFWEKGEKKTPFRVPGCCTESTGCNTEQKPEQEAVAPWTEKTEITAWKSQSTYHGLGRIGGKRMQAGNKSSTDPYDAWLSTALQGREKPAQGQRGTPKKELHSYHGVKSSFVFTYYRPKSWNSHCRHGDSQIRASIEQAALGWAAVYSNGNLIYSVHKT